MKSAPLTVLVTKKSKMQRVDIFCLSMRIQPSLSVRTSILPENMARSMLSCFVRVARNANRFLIIFGSGLDRFPIRIRIQDGSRRMSGGLPWEPRKVGVPKSVTFWYGSGDLYHGTFKDPNPALFFNDFQIPTKSRFFAFYLHLHQSKRQQVIKKSQTCKNQGFSQFF